MNNEQFPKPCRNSFDELSRTDSEKLLRWCQSGLLEPCDLTFALENLRDFPEALPFLIETMKNHQSSIVREGALLGINGILNITINEIKSVSTKDASPGVRYVAEAIYKRFC